MPTRRPGPRKEPVEIPLPDGRFLRTEIYPTTGKHHVRCDQCEKVITLATGRHTDGFLRHRKSAACSHGEGSSTPRNGQESFASDTNFEQHISSTQLPRLHRCPGAAVKWKAGSIWTTYAYHLHVGDEIPWEPVGFDRKNNIIFICDNNCAGQLSQDDDFPCHACSVLPFSPEFRKFEARVHTLKDYTWTAHPTIGTGQ